MLKIVQTPAARFACQRLCTPGDLCKFSAIFAAIGTTRVMSHTVQVTVQIKDKGPLSAAILAMGGTVLGEGTHQLYSSSEAGFGFKLPGWKFPLILRADNTMTFDDYHGQWGNPEDLKKLTGRYAIEAARTAADGQGWSSEDDDEGGLLIRHPSGGSLTVKRDGTVDAIGFIGSACDIAAVIEEAMGTPGEKAYKPEYYEHGGLRN